MTCREAIDRLAEYLDAELTPATLGRARDAPRRVRALPRLSRDVPRDERARGEGPPRRDPRGAAGAAGPAPHGSAPADGNALAPRHPGVHAVRLRAVGRCDAPDPPRYRLLLR